jgi:hypothetical protein
MTRGEISFAGLTWEIFHGDAIYMNNTSLIARKDGESAVIIVLYKKMLRTETLFFDYTPSNTLYFGRKTLGLSKNELLSHKVFLK